MRAHTKKLYNFPHKENYLLNLRIELKRARTVWKNLKISKKNLAIYVIIILLSANLALQILPYLSRHPTSQYSVIPLAYASSSASRNINFQGKLIDTNGNPLEGMYSMTFRIFTTLTGGSPMWTETHSNVTTDSNGIFNVLLGESQELDLTFSVSYWLEIVVEDETLTPRTVLTYAPYSFIVYVAPKGTSFPAEPEEGMWYYRTDIDEFYVYNGTGWKQCSVDSYSELYGTPDLTVYLLLDGTRPMTGNLNMSEHQVLAGVFHKGTVFPSSPTEGQWFYRTTDHALYVWDGSNWVEPTAWSSVESVSYIIYQDGSYTKAKNGTTNLIDYESRNASAVINSALGSLTNGRTWREKVLLKGNFSLTSKVLVPSYTILEIQGQVVLANNVNDTMFENSDGSIGNGFIEICEGVIDGNKANQAYSGPPIDKGSAIYLENCVNSTIHDVEIRNAHGRGISLRYCKHINVYNAYVHHCGVADRIAHDNVVFAHGQYNSIVNSMITHGYTDGVNFYNESYGRVSDFLIADCASGIAIDSGWEMYSEYISITGGIILRCWIQAIGIGAAFGGTQRHITITGVVFWDDNYVSNRLEIGSGSQTYTIYDVIVDGCVFDNIGENAIMLGYDGTNQANISTVIISDSTFRYTRKEAIWADADNGTIENLIISGCTFEEIAVGQSKPTINLEEVSGAIITDSYFGRNYWYMSGNSSYHVLLNSGCNNITIKDNDFRGNAKSPKVNLNGASDVIVKGNMGFVTENSGTATISNTNSVTFDHGLAGTPTLVLVSFNVTGWVDWGWNATSTQITITTTNNVNATCYWHAEYRP